MIAVVPSAPRVFGSAFSESNFNAVARSPDSAASSSVGFAGVANETAAIKAAQTTAASGQLFIRRVIHRAGNPRILDLRKNAATVAYRFHRNVVTVEHRQKQIRQARILRILQVLAALDAP